MRKPCVTAPAVKHLCVGPNGSPPPRHTPKRNNLPTARSRCQFDDVPTMGPTLCWQAEDENKVRTVFVLPRGHHFKMTCCSCRPPSNTHTPLTPPPYSVWRQIHWFPVSQWTCKGHFFLYRKESEENPLSYLYFLCLSCSTTLKIAPVLLCCVCKSWFETHVRPDEKRNVTFSWIVTVCVFVWK